MNLRDAWHWPVALNIWKEWNRSLSCGLFQMVILGLFTISKGNGLVYGLANRKQNFKHGNSIGDLAYPINQMWRVPTFTLSPWKPMHFIVRLALEQKLTHGKATLTTWEKKREKNKRRPRQSCNETNKEWSGCMHLQWKRPEFYVYVKQLPFIKSIHSWHFPVGQTKIAIQVQPNRNIWNCQVQV